VTFVLAETRNIEPEGRYKHRELGINWFWGVGQFSPDLLLYCPGPNGTPGMPSVLGHSTVAPCMSGAKEALRWRVDDEGKIAVPSTDVETLRPFVEFILPRPLHLNVPRGELTREQLRAALLEECEKHEWARARRKQVRDAAECMEECAPGGFVRVDKSAIDALSDKPGARLEELNL